MEMQMPWNERNAMMLREEFVIKAQEPTANISQLCREYDISRDVAYKWLRRYRENGYFGLSDRSKRPCCMPTRLSEESVSLILAARDEFPAWGAKKLLQLLDDRGHTHLPSIASANRILKRHNKINPLESDKRKPFCRFEKEFPNELWQMDFKGCFATTEGKCYPLTVLDDCSRFDLCLRACMSEDEISVRRALEAVFGEYGLPIAMTMDNGSPWRGGPGQRLSNLTVWLMRLGIQVMHSRPYHPQTQGKLERFHQSFKREVLRYHNFQNLKDAQINFDEWRYIYNHIRRHEAINMHTPAQEYKKSERKYTGSLPEIRYLPGDIVKQVSQKGEIRFQGKKCYMGNHLRGEPVAFRSRQEGGWDVYYFQTRIGGFLTSTVRDVLTQV